MEDCKQDRYTCEKIHEGVDRRLDKQEERINSMEECNKKLTELMIKMEAKSGGKKKFWESKWFDRLVLTGLILFVIIVLTALGRDFLLSGIIDTMKGGTP